MVKDLRKLVPKNMTFQALAETIGIRRVYLRQVLKREKEPSVGIAIGLAHVLGQPVEVLFPGKSRRVKLRGKP